MDKIITINLGGYAIRMEEDAYEALKPYIRQIEEAFAKTENGKEIINDIEARIAEMLVERTGEKVAATIEDVDFVKKAMGNPGEFEESNPGEGAPQSNQSSETVRKRLYRDTDNKVLGGVCSGISQYFNMDPVIIRIIWVCLIFFFGTGLLIYFILWIIVPEALTTAQKLEMKGEAPTLDNIINRVKTEAGKVEQNLKAQNFGQKIGEIFASLWPVVRALFKIIALFIGLAVLVVLSAVFISLLTGGTNILFNEHNTSFNDIPNIFDARWEFITFKVLIGLIICIPLFTILTGLLKFVFNSDANYKPVRRVLGWVWVATIPLLVYFSYSGIRNFRSFETVSTEKTEQIKDPILIKGAINEAGYFFGNIEVRITSSDDSLLHITTVQSANGRNEIQARGFAEKSMASYTFTGNELTLKTSDYFEKTGIFRKQRVTFNIQVPNGRSFTLDPSIKKTGVNVSGQNINYYADDISEKTNQLVFVNNSLFCPLCPDSIPYGSSGLMNYSNFNRIEVEGLIDVEIHKGSRFSIQKTGPKNIISHLRVDQYGDVLILEMENGYFNLKTKPKVIITMPELNSLKLSGASECKVDRFAGNDLYYESNGASNATLSADYGEIKIDMNGASRLNISGSTKNINMDISGASHLNSENMAMENVTIEINGASESILGPSKTITGEATGASILEYMGNPILQVNSTGVSKIKQYDRKIIE